MILLECFHRYFILFDSFQPQSNDRGIFEIQILCFLNVFGLYPKVFKKHVILVEIISSISYSYSKYFWNIVLVPKTFENYSMCTKKLAKESGIGPKTFGKYMILSQNVGKVLHFSEKHSKNIAFCKENIRRVSSSEPNHSRNTKVQDKPFEKYCICQSSDQIIRFLLNIYAIHLKSFVFVPAKKGKYLFLTKTIQEISNFYKKNLKNIFILSQTCWDGLRYMGALTLNNAFFPRISNAHIFRTTHRIVMIFSSKCRWKVIWQILSTIRTVEYSTGPMRTLKEPIYWASNLAPKLMVWKHQKLLVEQKNWIFQSPRYRYTNPTTEKETSNQC